MFTALYPFGYEQHQKASKVISHQQELLKNEAKKPKKKQIHGTVPLTWHISFPLPNTVAGTNDCPKKGNKMLLQVTQCLSHHSLKQIMVPQKLFRIHMHYFIS